MNLVEATGLAIASVGAFLLGLTTGSIMITLAAILLVGGTVIFFMEF